MENKKTWNSCNHLFPTKHSMFPLLQSCNKLKYIMSNEFICSPFTIAGTSIVIPILCGMWFSQNDSNLSRFCRLVMSCWNLACKRTVTSPHSYFLLLHNHHRCFGPSSWHQWATNNNSSSYLLTLSWLMSAVQFICLRFCSLVSRNSGWVGLK